MSLLSFVIKIKNLDKLMNQEQTNKQKYKQTAQQNPWSLGRLTLPTMNSMGCFGVVNCGRQQKAVNWLGAQETLISGGKKK